MCGFIVKTHCITARMDICGRRPDFVVPRPLILFELLFSYRKPERSGMSCPPYDYSLENVNGSPGERAIPTTRSLASIHPETQHQTIELNYTSQNNIVNDGAKLPDAPPTYTAAMLPPGWEHKKDQWGRVYYIDHNRGVTMWESPSNVPPPQPTLDSDISQQIMSAVASASASAHNASGAPVVIYVNIGGSTPNSGVRATVAPRGASMANAGTFRVPHPPPLSDIGRTTTTNAIFPTQQAALIPPLCKRIAPQPAPNFTADFDWSATTQAEMDDFPTATFKADKSIAHLGCCDALADTASRNSCCCLWSVVIWIMAIITLVVNIAAPFRYEDYWYRYAAYSFYDYTAALTSPPIITALVLGGLYAIWFLTIVLPTCFCCGWLQSCTMATSGIYMLDKPLEAMKLAEASDSTRARSYFSKLESAKPVLQLHVECFHADAPCFTREQLLVSAPLLFRVSCNIQIERWKDISPTEAEFQAAISEHTDDCALITYECMYQLPPSQLPVLEALKKRLVDEHRYAHATTIVWLSYDVEGHDTTRMDVVANPLSSVYSRYRFWANWWMFYLSVWTTLYLPYIACWKRVQKPVKRPNIKYIHLAVPNLQLYAGSHNNTSTRTTTDARR